LSSTGHQVSVGVHLQQERGAQVVPAASLAKWKCTGESSNLFTFSPFLLTSIKKLHICKLQKFDYFFVKITREI
jgi:hypothetical protein